MDVNSGFYEGFTMSFPIYIIRKIKLQILLTILKATYEAIHYI